MEKRSISSSYDYIMSKERLLRFLPCKNFLYRNRKFFHARPFLYLFFKSLFGIFLFATPISLLLFHFEKKYYTDYKDSNENLALLPILISCSFLILYCLFFLIWRIFSSIKCKNFMAWDRNNCGNLLETLVILICILVYLIDQYKYFHELKYQVSSQDNNTNQEVDYTIVFNLIKRNNITFMIALIFLLFRIVFFQTKNTIFYILIHTGLLFELIVIDYDIFVNYDEVPFFPIVYILIVIFLMSFKRLLNHLRKVLLLFYDLFICISALILILVTIIQTKTLDEEFKYHMVTFFSILIYIFSNSYYFGHYFIELMFKPIEIEYIVISQKKFAKISTLSKYTQYSKNINSLQEEPFISNKKENF